MNMQVGKVNNFFFFFQKVKGFYNKDDKNILHAFIFSYYLHIVVAATIDGFDWI